MYTYKVDVKQAPESNKLFLGPSAGTDYSVPTLLLLILVLVMNSIWPLSYLGATQYPQELLKVVGFGVLQLKVLKITTEHLQHCSEGMHVLQGIT